MKKYIRWISTFMLCFFLTFSLLQGLQAKRIVKAIDPATALEIKEKVSGLVIAFVVTWMGVAYDNIANQKQSITDCIDKAQAEGVDFYTDYGNGIIILKAEGISFIKKYFTSAKALPIIDGQIIKLPYVDGNLELNMNTLGINECSMYCHRVGNYIPFAYLSSSGTAAGSINCTSDSLVTVHLTRSLFELFQNGAKIYGDSKSGMYGVRLQNVQNDSGYMSIHTTVNLTSSLQNYDNTKNIDTSNPYKIVDGEYDYTKTIYNPGATAPITNLDGTAVVPAVNGSDIPAEADNSNVGDTSGTLSTTAINIPIIGTIVKWLINIWNGIRAIPHWLVQIWTGIKEIPGELSKYFTDVKTAITSIPGEISSSFTSAMTSLFEPTKQIDVSNVTYDFGFIFPTVDQNTPFVIQLPIGPKYVQEMKLNNPIFQDIRAIMLGFMYFAFSLKIFKTIITTFTSLKEGEQLSFFDD